MAGEKSPEELYQERLKRVKDVVALRVPDRVPVFGPYQAFPYYWTGVTIEQAMNDYALCRDVCHKFVDEYQPDLDFGPIFAYPAKPMETLGLRWFKWAGHGLGENVMYQYVEDEYMTADEYDEFLYDPSHFMTTKWLPRSFANLEGLAGFPPMRQMMWFGWTGLLTQFTDPALQEALKVALEAGEELARWFGSIGQYAGEIKEKGYPQAYASFSWAPFDIIGDTLRGTRGIMTDVIRHPDKLLAATEKATQLTVEYGSGAAGADMPLCWIWLHKGSEGFMSDAQFKKFYWPSLKKAIEGLVDLGVIPMVYCEGDETSRLEYFAEVPPGKVLFHFAQMDMVRAKEVLHGIAAFSGNVPNRLMLTGTPDDVRAYCKKLIDACGKDGGYIMDTSALLDEAKPENLKAMIDFTKEYGVYR
ncbi:MAG: uroporphyrinogen decarboxylase family protein [Candidatus Promineifilaceae bacterium]